MLGTHARSRAADRIAGSAGGRRWTCAGTTTSSSTGSSCCTQPRAARSPTRSIADIARVSPETTVRAARRRLRRSRGTSSRSTARCTTSRARYPFDPDREDYLVHVTTGTHVAQICLFLLTESRYFPARLVQTAPPRAAAATSSRARIAIIDLDLSKYDRLAARFEQQQREDLSFLKAGIETRNAAVQRADRAHRAGRDRVARAAAADGADRRGQVAPRAADLRAEEGAAAGDRASSSR